MQIDKFYLILMEKSIHKLSLQDTIFTLIPGVVDGGLLFNQWNIVYCSYCSILVPYEVCKTKALT